MAKISASIPKRPSHNYLPQASFCQVSLAVELVKAGQVDDAKRVLKAAFELDTDLRFVTLDHPGLNAIWR